MRRIRVKRLGVALAARFYARRLVFLLEIEVESPYCVRGYAREAGSRAFLSRADCDPCFAESSEPMRFMSRPSAAYLGDMRRTGRSGRFAMSEVGRIQQHAISDDAAK